MEIGSPDIFENQFSVSRLQSSEGNRSELGQEDFLRLIVAQIQNQDPFEPVENGEFIGQLAQFGTVDGVNNLNEAFAEFSQSLLGNQTLNAAGLIGKSVLVDGNQISVTSDQPIEAFVDANGQSGTASVQISNAAGELVQTKQVSLTNAGLNSFTWDGLDVNGDVVPEGAYFLSATILSGDSEFALSTTVKNKIQSVNINSSGSNEIELGLASGGTILFNEIKQISQ